MGYTIHWISGRMSHVTTLRKQVGEGRGGGEGEGRGGEANRLSLTSYIVAGAGKGLMRVDGIVRKGPQLGSRHLVSRFGLAVRR